MMNSMFYPVIIASQTKQINKLQTELDEERQNNKRVISELSELSEKLKEEIKVREHLKK